ncbi:hypothetical protein, partial [Brevundimonas sp.]|uniref:hypothetical protein n=1 Tax=Brevundimonas sp. TaxID=1871086 RepID=UPI00391B1B6C
RYEEMEAREARMEREAADRRAAEAAANEEPLVIPQAPSGAIRDVAPPLHCFSAPESHQPAPDDDDRMDDADDPARDLLRLSTQLAAVARQVEKAAREAEDRLRLHRFSPSESNAAPETNDRLTRLAAGLDALSGQAERALTDEVLALQLHCFSRPESHTPGPEP